MYKPYLKWTPAHPIRKPDNIISSPPKPVFKPLYLHESTENIKFLLTNEYMRMWFKEKAVYDKNTYIRDQIIRDECKIKRRTIQRMATFRKQSKNQFIEDFLERKIGRNKPTRKDQELRQENLKYKPECPKLAAENKKETKIHKAKSSSKPVRSTTSKVNKDKEESEESYEGCEIVVRPLNCVQSG